MSNGTMSPTPYLWMSLLYIHYMHSPNCLFDLYPYIYMVDETNTGHETTRFNTEAERNKNNALKFSICDKVESSIIRDTVPKGIA